MEKNSKSAVGLFVSNAIIILICYVMYAGLKNSDAPFGQFLGMLKVIVLFPILHLLAGLIFWLIKSKLAMKIHLIIGGLAVVIITILILWSKTS